MAAIHEALITAIAAASDAVAFTPDEEDVLVDGTGICAVANPHSSSSRGINSGTDVAGGPKGVAAVAGARCRGPVLISPQAAVIAAAGSMPDIYITNIASGGLSA